MLFPNLKITYEREIKRTLVRYIYHEVRSPLNVIFLGIDLVESKIHEIKSKLVAAVYRDCCKLVADMKKACGAALDILDNLSIYEKIMGNNFTLLKLMHPVKSTVEDILSQFYPQVRCWTLL
jgi:signal transduction histidine kinase